MRASAWAPLTRRRPGNYELFCILYSVICLRGNGVILRTQKVIQGGDNGHVGRPCEVSPGSSLSGTLLRVTGPLPSLVLRTEDM